MFVIRGRYFSRSLVQVIVVYIPGAHFTNINFISSMDKLLHPL